MTLRRARLQLHASNLCKSILNSSGTDSTAERRARWNEMKIVGSFKDTPHPAIISFYSFIVTPSFAMITMCVAFMLSGTDN